MNRLEQRGVLAQRRRGLQAHRAGDAGGLVGQDVAEGILSHHYVEEGGLREHAHRGIVNEHIIGINLGILGFHFLGNLTPQTAGSQHVSLIDNSQVLLTRHRHLESNLQDALNLWTCIDIGIVSLVVVLVFLAKVHATRQLTNHHEVRTTQQFVLQG